MSAIRHHEQMIDGATYRELTWRAYFGNGLNVRVRNFSEGPPGDLRERLGNMGQEAHDRGGALLRSAPGCGISAPVLALSEEPVLSRPVGHFSAGATPQLAHDVDAMRVHGPLGEDQLLGYLPVRQPLCY